MKILLAEDEEWIKKCNDIKHIRNPGGRQSSGVPDVVLTLLSAPHTTWCFLKPSLAGGSITAVRIAYRIARMERASRSSPLI